mmetsp:Transcript_1464/g.4328  ORF Transcript_1464/g.4328 Transcript_1464/m.4328 type:complete len:311 (+) Transcript_1464:1296-2228(+)
MPASSVSASQATTKSSGSTAHDFWPKDLPFQRCTAPSSCTSCTRRTGRPPAPGAGCWLRSFMPQPSPSPRLSSASHTPGEACAAIREKTSLNSFTDGFESTSNIKAAVLASFTAMSRSPALTSGLRRRLAGVTAPLCCPTKPAGDTSLTSRPPSSSLAVTKFKPMRRASAPLSSLPLWSSTGKMHRMRERLSRKRSSKDFGSKNPGAHWPKTLRAQGCLSKCRATGCGPAIAELLLPPAEAPLALDARAAASLGPRAEASVPAPRSPSNACWVPRGGLNRILTLVFLSSLENSRGSVRPFTDTTTDPSNT